MLIFTNRAVDSLATDPSAFGRSFTPAAATLGFASVDRASAGWSLGGVTADASDNAALALLVGLFQGGRPVLAYLHGNNNTPAACFERCARVAEIYDVEVVGFSWPSEGFLSDGSDLPGLLAAAADETDADADALDRALVGVHDGNRTEGAIQRKIRRYQQAKVNAKESIDAVARFFRLLATARLFANQQKLTIAAHSLGVHLLKNTIEVPAAAESIGTAQNIVLLAACVRAGGHAEWLAKLHPKGQVFVTFNKGDTVLLGAFIADNHETKLGTEPGPELLRSGAVRYISFTGARTGAFGHRYFVADTGDKVPKDNRKLFTRLFRSERDIGDGELPRKAYPVGCDADLLTCFMAAPVPVEGGGPNG